jgi:hypothetical protein
MGRHPRQLRVAILVVLLGSPLRGSKLPRFVDHSEASGLDVVTYSGSIEKPHILESTGNGVLVLDYDGDGYLDLYFVAAFRLPHQTGNEAEKSVLYRNNGDGTFTDVTERAGVGARVYGHGGCVGDFDADGLPDIYLTAYGDNLLYRNNGDGTFTDVACQAGVLEPRWSIGATFFDADGDGDQDLYVGNYIEATWEEILSARRTRLWRGKVAVMDGPRGLREDFNAFYLNNGDGTFRAATEEAGLAVGGYGYTMGVTSFDYDNDGDIDLYLANDSTANRLYRNRGNGTFEEVGTWTGSAYNADGRMQGSMGVGFGDYDGDGWFDLAVTNFAHDYYALYRNLSGELFQDESFVSQLAVPSFVPLGWAPLFFDADNDGDLDLFFSNGHIYPQVDEDPSLKESYKQRNQLLLNEAGRFREVSQEAGAAFEIQESSRGAAYVDIDNDGDLDLAISNQDAKPTLLANVTPETHRWVLVDLRQSASWRRPLGARIGMEAGGRRQIREVTSGGSYASENDPRLHFGLGDAPTVQRLDVTWPGGKQVSLRGVVANRIYLVWRDQEPGAPADGG